MTEGALKKPVETIVVAIGLVAMFGFFFHKGMFDSLLGTNQATARKVEARVAEFQYKLPYREERMTIVSSKVSWDSKLHVHYRWHQGIDTMTGEDLDFFERSVRRDYCQAPDLIDGVARITDRDDKPARVLTLKPSDCRR